MTRTATLTRQSMLSSLSDNNRLRLFSGSANFPLSQEIARYLGMDIGPLFRKSFAAGELYIQIPESIRGGGCVPHSTELSSRQRQLDGTPDYG